MGLKICQLTMFAGLLLCLGGCDGEEKGSEFDDLDRMAHEQVQPAQHQNIAEGLQEEGEGLELR